MTNECVAEKIHAVHRKDSYTIVATKQFAKTAILLCSVNTPFC